MADKPPQVGTLSVSSTTETDSHGPLTSELIMEDTIVQPGTRRRLERATRLQRIATLIVI